MTRMTRHPSQERSRSGEPRHSLRQPWRTTYPRIFPVEFVIDGTDQSEVHSADLSEVATMDLSAVHVADLSSQATADLSWVHFADLSGERAA